MSLAGILHGMSGNLGELTEKEVYFEFVREGFENGKPVVYKSNGSWSYRDYVAGLKMCNASGCSTSTGNAPARFAPKPAPAPVGGCSGGYCSPYLTTFPPPGGANLKSGDWEQIFLDGKLAWHQKSTGLLQYQGGGTGRLTAPNDPSLVLQSQTPWRQQVTVGPQTNSPAASAPDYAAMSAALDAQNKPKLDAMWSKFVAQVNADTAPKPASGDSWWDNTWSNIFGSPKPSVSPYTADPFSTSIYNPPEPVMSEPVDGSTLFSTPKGPSWWDSTWQSLFKASEPAKTSPDYGVEWMTPDAPVAPASPPFAPASETEGSYSPLDWSMDAFGMAPAIKPEPSVWDSMWANLLSSPSKPAVADNTDYLYQPGPWNPTPPDHTDQIRDSLGINLEQAKQAYSTGWYNEDSSPQQDFSVPTPTRAPSPPSVPRLTCSGGSCRLIQSSVPANDTYSPDYSAAGQAVAMQNFNAAPVAASNQAQRSAIQQQSSVGIPQFSMPQIDFSSILKQTQQPTQQYAAAPVTVVGAPPVADHTALYLALGVAGAAVIGAILWSRR